jgi:thioredoxin reductase
MRTAIPVTVVGAGPYGLSVAAHLAGAGVKTRVFGQPMQTWRSYMPNGMVLKSEGFAMNISDPDDSYTLERYCRDHGIAYRPTGWPVPVKVFAGYGEAFQKRLVPHLEPTLVRTIQPAETGYSVTLASGEVVPTRHVVLAVGIRAYARGAEALADLPADRVTHSADQGDMEAFRGRRVAVLGGGASAMDAAAALYRSGATPIAITHRPEVRFYAPGTLRDRFLSPLTPLGPGWKKQLCCTFPDLFHALPEKTRIDLVSSYLGPSPAWSVRDIIHEHVDLRLNTDVVQAKVEGDAVALTLRHGGATETLTVDHVIAATGYRFDVDRLTMLAPEIRAVLRRDRNALKLNHSFETRMPGLQVVGTPASPSFGPILRFVCGTAFAARRTAGAIARREAARARRPASVPARRAMPLSEA